MRRCKHALFLLIAGPLATSALSAFADDPVQQQLDRERDKATALAAEATRKADDWRYRYHNNQWWYYTPEHRWVYHQKGTWMPYDPKNYLPPATKPDYRGYYYHNGNAYLPAVRSDKDPAALPNPITGRRYPDRVLTGTPKTSLPATSPTRRSKDRSTTTSARDTSARAPNRCSSPARRRPPEPCQSR